MYTVSPEVTHFRQVTPYDCWHACLRMMTKWSRGAEAEPGGTITDWLFASCQAGHQTFQSAKDAALRSYTAPDQFDRANAGKKATAEVAEWAKMQSLYTNMQEYRPFVGARPGLTCALLPSILSENRLWAVRGKAIQEEMKDTLEDVERMLRLHGPLYCLLGSGFGHVVVVVGVKGEKLVVCDPSKPQQSEAGLKFVSDSPCVARLV